MTTLAAIDAGSNAIRLAIGRVQPSGGLDIIESYRFPVRLGRDAFSTGRLSQEIMWDARAAFLRFAAAMSRQGVEGLSAVGTSALREARNGAELIERIRRDTGIQIRLIDGAEEARLVHMAVSRKIDISQGTRALVDVGGGSVEVSLTADGDLIESQSFAVGAVRMLETLVDPKRGFPAFMAQIAEIKDATENWCSRLLGHHLIGEVVGTGGNVETVGDLTGRRVGKRATSFASAGDLQHIRAQLEALTYHQRQRELRLKPDRADVIYTAVIVLQALMNAFWASSLVIPRVGLRDGALIELAERHAPARSAVLTLS